MASLFSEKLLEYLRSFAESLRVDLLRVRVGPFELLEVLLDGLDTLRHSGLLVTLTQHLHLFFVSEPVREISEEEGWRADGGEAFV